MKTINDTMTDAIPQPSGRSVILIGGTAIAGYINNLTHDDISFVCSMIMFSCGMISYTGKLIKWLSEKDNDKK